MVDRNLGTARSASERFNNRLDVAHSFDESLAFEYQVAKQAFASTFQKLALAQLDLDSFKLDDLKKSLAEHMAGLFGGLVDSSLLRVTGYTSPHPLVYALLAENVGQPLPGWRLRILTADAIHTERRTRELRDMGLDIAITGNTDAQNYTLNSVTPDWTYGAAYQLRKNARDNKRLDAAERDHVIALAEKTAALPNAQAGA